MEDFIQEETTIEEQTSTTEAAVVPEPPAPPKRKKHLWLIFPCVAVIVLAAAYFLTANLRQYTQAGKLYEEGQYALAAESYGQLADYKDAATKVIESRYAQAGELMTQKDYTGALNIYQQLGSFKESAQRVLECYYKLAETALEAGDLETCVEYFTLATDDFRDAKQRRLNVTYQWGHELYMDGEYDKAQACFDLLEGYWPESGGPHFVTLDEALEYITTQAQMLPEEVRVVVKDLPGTYQIRPDTLHTLLQQRLGYQFAHVDYAKETQTITLNPDYYPGQKMIYAWRTGDFSKLSEREIQAYEKAQELVAEAIAADPDPEAVELWIHDWICANTVYDSPYEYVYPEDYVGLDELTCVGVLLDGVANCQGYTDAFYLMGTLAGLEVCKMFGEVEGGGHCWNGVTIDGDMYLVDVTFNDTIFEEAEYWSYIWYNNAMDLDTYYVWGGSNLFKGLVFMRDISKTYYTRVGAVYPDMGEAAYALLRNVRKIGPGVYHAIVENKELDTDDFHRAAVNNVFAAGRSVHYMVHLEYYEGDTYIWVELT